MLKKRRRQLPGVYEVFSRQGIGGLDKQSVPASVESLTRESTHGVWMNKPHQASRLDAAVEL
jgi:hypothetical protein